MKPVRYELERLVTVRTFAAPWAAQLARARLEAAGIEAVVADEHLSRMITINTVGGARLQVRERDAAAAVEVLSREAALPELYLVTEEDAARPRCPGCKSDRIAFERWSRLGFVSSWILFGIPIPIPKNRWLCRSCGATWKEEELPPRRRLQPEEPAMAEMDEMAALAEMGEPEDLAVAGDAGALVAVARFTAPWEAHLARTRLETEGIAACVLEERLPLANLFSGQLAALSRVAVRTEDARHAREVLKADDLAALEAGDLDD
jgi:transposase-like protein